MVQASAISTPSKADQSRNRILDAAAMLFSRRGFSAVSLRDIAATVDMKAGSVYYHFDSKETLVLEVLNLGIFLVHDEVADAIRRLPDDAPSSEILRAGILSHLRSLFEFSDYTSASVRIHHQVPDEVRLANGIARRRYDGLWDDILQSIAAQGGLRDGVDLKTFRSTLISSLNATLDWFDGRQRAIAPLADSCADLYLNGLLNSNAS